MRFLTKREVSERVAYHPVHIMRLAKARKFPQPLKLRPGGRVVFVEDEVTAWQEKRITERDAVLTKRANG